MSKLTQAEAFKIATKDQFAIQPIPLGPLASYSVLNDPKHMCFVLSRYKFCAKMLTGKESVLEVGCGDALGIPIVAQDARYVLGIDVDSRLIKGNRSRLKMIKNLNFKKIDICQRIPKGKFDAVYSIDVIEHLDRHLEKSFIENICKVLKDDGVCIIGTPNKNAGKYATKRSRIQHINLKDHKTLRKLFQRYFINTFIFSMNDELVHTGFYAMAQYLFAVGVGVKR